MPPRKNITVMEMMYRMAMRLWSLVNSQDFQPYSAFK